MNNQSDLLFLIKHLSKCIEMGIDQETEKLGLTPQQARVLFYLVRHDEKKIKQMDLCEHFHLSKSTVSGLVKRLVLKSLIIKEKTKEGTILHPSEKAKALFEEQREKISQFNEQIFGDLSLEEKRKLEELLKDKIQLLKGDKLC